jgi:hypothetical protein
MTETTEESKSIGSLVQPMPGLSLGDFIQSFLTVQDTRVARVMDAVFAGTISNILLDSDDRRYCADLGLVVPGEQKKLRPANPLYGEVMSRVITDQIAFQLQDSLAQTKWTEGQVILMTDVLKDFQKFWRHDSNSFPLRKNTATALNLDEATYFFMLLAYLKKVVNSGAKVHRQYAEGRGVVDIYVMYQNKEYLIDIKICDNSFYSEGIV